jgi:hypothetical protein
VASKRPVVLAITSDHHCGSTLGLCPPEGVRIDEGAEYHPNKGQLWTWSCWESYWHDVAALRAKHGAELWCAYNGDAVDGDHHNTSQIISRNPEPQSYLLDRVFGVPAKLNPDRQFAIRGTEVHVGPAGSTEETWAKRLANHVRNPETKSHSWWHCRPEIHGVRFDFQHHGRVGGRPWTRASAIAQLAAHIFYEHAEAGEPPPHFAIRSHCHTYGDSYDATPTRVIQTPAWQLKTAHGHRAVPEAITRIGGIIITVFPDGSTDVQKRIYRPSLPKTWKAA